MVKWKIWIPVALLICVGFGLTDCRKSGSKSVVDMDTDSTVMARLNFKPGSYWIYRDDITGRIDSFFVRTNEYVKQEETYNIYNYHIITIVQQNVDGKNPADSANWVFNYQATKIMMEMDYTVNNYGWKNQIQFSPLFIFPFVYGDLVAKYDTASIPRIDSHYAVNGMSFYRVAHVLHTSDADSTMGAAITTLNDSFLVNDSVGLITMQIHHPFHSKNHHWKLLRFNIVR